ncbi:hypothetical protein JGU71_28265 [Antrihabitans sp. YC3-6]|uniref:Uncharacterized protein n=1 Tax=Antrihabitans stalagmiti TaxID=2799499 RepID=A0A934NWD5_9NOCA|nr:hypothetical protein [Antrihabitans stalagmiti]MBJ8342791.1 hypothetical protein [Antrihabitans stalagmiti]
MPSIEDQLIACRAQLKAARAAGKTEAAEFLALRMDLLLDRLPRTQEASPC